MWLRDEARQGPPRGEATRWFRGEASRAHAGRDGTSLRAEAYAVNPESQAIAGTDGLWGET